VKARFVFALQKRLINPPIRFLLSRGFIPRSYALLETTGRRSGRPRRTPVGNGLDGDTFWIVSEHGRASAYVRNIEANPRVRLKLWTGPLRSQWRSGTARVVEDDDPRERQRLITAGSLGRRINAATVRLMGTDLLTVRIDLDQPTDARTGPGTPT
jgi:deazaflavin-dependent oxidoreductase (nitroreductase family)